ncbi:MAG: M48 family metalloprotease [Bacteroidota bacterium]
MVLYLALTLIIPLKSFSQFDKDYQPRAYHSKKSRVLISKLQKQLDEEWGRVHTKRRFKVYGAYEKRTNAIIDQIKAKAFINDDSLNIFIENILIRLNAGKQIEHGIKTVLISRNPEVNAYCVGEGTIILNVGLLARIRNESELAYVMAHEIAHYHLDHVKDRTVNSIESGQKKEIKKQLTEFFTGEIELDQVDQLRNLVYGLGNHSRKAEMDADSMGYVLFKQTAYDHEQMFNMLSILDSAQHPRLSLGDDVFKDLDFSKYPFQDHWRRKRLSIYEKQGTGFIFNSDSLKTHPGIQSRKDKLTAYFSRHDTRNPNIQAEDYVDWVVRVARFESAEGAFFAGRYDQCLHEALQLKAEFPQNAYVTSLISRVLIKIYQVKDNAPQFFNYFVPDYTIHYSNELRSVNNFLHHLDKVEVGEIAYHFLNNQSNFKSSKEEHFYLLWRICELTGREEVSKKIKATHAKKFPQGKFISQFK